MFADQQEEVINLNRAFWDVDSFEKKHFLI